MVSGSSVLAASGRATAGGEGGVDSNFIPATSSQDFTSCPQPGMPGGNAEILQKSSVCARYFSGIFTSFGCLLGAFEVRDAGLLMKGEPDLERL